MVIPVYGVSEGEDLCDWIYTNPMMSPEVLVQKSKIQSDRFHQTFCGDIKSSQKDNPMIPDIFFSTPVSPSNSTVYTGRIVYSYWLFYVLVNKLLELNEVLIHLFVAENKCYTNTILLYSVTITIIYPWVSPFKWLQSWLQSFAIFCFVIVCSMYITYHIYVYHLTYHIIYHVYVYH